METRSDFTITLVVDLASSSEEVEAVLTILDSIGLEVATTDYGYLLESVQPPWIVDICVFVGTAAGQLLVHTLVQVLDKMIDPYTDAAVDEVHNIMRKLQFLGKSIYDARRSMSPRNGSVLISVLFEDPSSGKQGRFEVPLLTNASKEVWEQMMYLKVRDASMLYVESEGKWMSEKERLDQMMKTFEDESE